MNRIQTVIVGVLCVIAAFGSFVVGTQYSGVWFILLSVLYPATVTGAYLLYIFREKVDNVNGKLDLRHDLPYLVAIAAPLVLLLISLVVLGR